MFRPSLRSEKTLMILAIIAIILYIFVARTNEVVESRWHDSKVKAAKMMQKQIIALKDESIKRNFEIDITNDPAETGIIGINNSLITTSRGTIDSKILSLNPNLAATYVDLLKLSGVKSGDYIAVGLTGANPGANLAFYAAATTLKLKPIIITSLGSAMFGANREDFTWLDMEKVLKEKKLINFTSSHASLGGGQDLGRGLSKAGRNLLVEAIARNNVKLIKGANLEDNIHLREIAYKNEIPKNKQYKLFVNIGGGLANVGNFVNATLIKNGLNRKLAEQEFVNPGIFMSFASKNIPVIHIFQVKKIIEKYGLSLEPDKIKTVKIGTGKVYSTTRKNVKIATVCLIVIIVLVVIAVLIDRKERHLINNIVKHD